MSWHLRDESKTYTGCDKPPLHVGTESKRKEPVRIEFVNLRINHDPPHEMSLKNVTFSLPARETVIHIFLRNTKLTIVHGMI